MRKKQPKVIGSVVRNYRMGLGMTQAEIAEVTDVAPETISRIERNKIATSLELTRKLAAALQVTVDELIQPGERPKRPALRPAESRLLSLMRELDDAQVDEVTRALKTLMALGELRALARGSPASK